MDSLVKRKMVDEDLPEVMKLSVSFNHIDRFPNILNGAINYVILDEEKIIGCSSWLRQQNHWSFTIFNIDIVSDYANEEVYIDFIEYMLNDIHHEGGYTINIVCYPEEDVLVSALESCGFELNDSRRNSDYKIYTLFQSV